MVWATNVIEYTTVTLWVLWPTLNVSVYGEDYTNFEDLKPGQAGDDKSDNSKKSKEDKLKNNLSTPGKKINQESDTTLVEQAKFFFPCSQIWLQTMPHFGNLEPSLIIKACYWHCGSS